MNLRFAENSLTVFETLCDLHYFLCLLFRSHVLTPFACNCPSSNKGEVACRFVFRSFLLLLLDFGEFALPDIRTTYQQTIMFIFGEDDPFNGHFFIFLRQ